MFGNTIRNKRKQSNIRLVTNEKTRNRLASSVSYNGIKHKSGNLEMFDMSNKKVSMNMRLDFINKNT